MITIDLLKNHPECITRIAQIWYEVLGKKWFPDIGIQQIASGYLEELNDDIPLAYVALYNDSPVGTCSLQLYGGIRPELQPWLGDLVVDIAYQKQGIGKVLIDTAKNKARLLGFSNLYLFTFDPTLPDYYSKLGWRAIGMDKFNGHPVTVMQVAL